MSAAAAFQSEVSVVLTATIQPNVAGAATQNPETRLAEYRQVVQYCQQFAPVYFLENSNYPLDRHPEFAESSRLRIRRFAPSQNPERGKGYQEFEMVDAWVASEVPPPDRWLKITGRYQLLNLAAVLAECRRAPPAPFLIDQIYHKQWARTYLFYVRTDFYQAQLRGLYRQCDDRNGDDAFVERVLFRRQIGWPAGQVQLFQTQPWLRAVAGTTGTAYPSGRFQWLAKGVLRWLNRLADRRYLRYAAIG